MEADRGRLHAATRSDTTADGLDCEVLVRQVQRHFRNVQRRWPTLTALAPQPDGGFLATCERHNCQGCVRYTPVHEAPYSPATLALSLSRPRDAPFVLTHTWHSHADDHDARASYPARAALRAVALSGAVLNPVQPPVRMPRTNGAVLPADPLSAPQGPAPQRPECPLQGVSLLAHGYRRKLAKGPAGRVFGTVRQDWDLDHVSSLDNGGLLARCNVPGCGALLLVEPLAQGQAHSPADVYVTHDQHHHHNKRGAAVAACQLNRRARTVVAVVEAAGAPAAGVLMSAAAVVAAAAPAAGTSAMAVETNYSPAPLPAPLLVPSLALSLAPLLVQQLPQLPTPTLLQLPTPTLLLQNAPAAAGNGAGGSGAVQPQPQPQPQASAEAAADDATGAPAGVMGPPPPTQAHAAAAAAAAEGKDIAAAVAAAEDAVARTRAELQRWQAHIVGLRASIRSAAATAAPMPHLVARLDVAFAVTNAMISGAVAAEAAAAAAAARVVEAAATEERTAASAVAAAAVAAAAPPPVEEEAAAVAAVRVPDSMALQDAAIADAPSGVAALPLEPPQQHDAAGAASHGGLSVAAAPLALAAVPAASLPAQDAHVGAAGAPHHQATEANRASALPGAHVHCKREPPVRALYACVDDDGPASRRPPGRMGVAAPRCGAPAAAAATGVATAIDVLSSDSGGGSASDGGGTSTSSASSSGAGGEGVELVADLDPVAARRAKRQRVAQPGQEGGASGSGGEEGGDEGVCLAGEVEGQVPTRDLPHPRHACAVHAFTAGTSTSNSACCGQCYCYVCDVKAPACRFWGTGKRARDHAHAHRHDYWDWLRRQRQTHGWRRVTLEHRARGPLPEMENEAQGE